MKTKPAQETTRDYARFIYHEQNRLTTGENGYVPRKELIQSMRKDGFWEIAPITCRKLPNGQLKVIDGHNRLTAAIMLNLPVHYIAYEQNGHDITPVDFSVGQKQWSFNQIIDAHINTIGGDYVELDEYCKRTGISNAIAAGMFMNNAPSSNNIGGTIKAGNFVIKNREVPAAMETLVKALKNHVTWATTVSCLNALYRCIVIPEFDLFRFISKINRFPELLEKQRDVNKYVELFDEIYNRHTKGKRLHLAIRSKEVMQSRNIANQHKEKSQ
jgi:hypothetical protein